MRKLPRTGVIRDYDMHSASVRIGYGLIYALCIFMMVFAVFPLIWVVLAGFKDLKEFMSSTSLLPRSFSLATFIKSHYLFKTIICIGECFRVCAEHNCLVSALCDCRGIVH